VTSHWKNIPLRFSVKQPKQFLYLSLSDKTILTHLTIIKKHFSGPFKTLVVENIVKISKQYSSVVMELT